MYFYIYIYSEYHILRRRRIVKLQQIFREACLQLFKKKLILTAINRIYIQQ